jgi:hypothetical protein
MAKRLGHVNPAVILKGYAHVMPDDDRLAVRLGKLIGHTSATVTADSDAVLRNDKSRNPFGLRLLCRMGATGLEPVTPTMSTHPETAI